MFKFLSRLFNRLMGTNPKDNNESDTQELNHEQNEKNQSTGGMMAEISINGRKKVSTLKREFKAEYGLTLDVKKGKSNVSAEPHKTLSQVRDESAPSGSSFTIRSNMKVGNLEKKFLGMGVKINIKTAGGSFISNDKTLGSVRTK